MAAVIALLEYNDLGRSVTPTYLFRNRFYLQLSTHCPKMNKKSMWERKKKLTISVHGTSNRHHVAAKPVKLWSLNANLFFKEPHEFSKFRLIGPFKPHLAENISLQSSYCNILGLSATVAVFANEARFTQI